MGLIQDMGKKGRAVKLPVPTTAGDDQVIAAKTGEYVLPPEVVQAIGLDKLNALVQSITGQQPGGQPAEMPQMDGHPMMDEQIMGHANGGLISKFSASPLNADPLQDNRESLRKYGFDGGMGSDSVATEISRAAKGLPMADEVMQAGMDKMAQKAMQPQRKRLDLAGIRDLEAMGALGEDSNIMGYNNGGLIARMKGYAEGGIVEDDYTRRKLSGYNPQETIRQPMAGRPAPVDPNVLRNYNPQSTIRQPASPDAPAPVDANALRGYNPQSTIPPNATTNASPRAPELRTFTPEAGRLSPQPEGTYARPSGIAAEAPRGTPSRTIAELDARAASGPRMEAARRGVQQVQASRAINPAKGTIRGLAGAAIAPTIEVADQFVTGADADVRNQFYNDPNVGTLEKAKQFGRDAAGVVLPSAGAVVGGGVGSVFAPVAGTAVGGIAGYGAGKAADAGLQAALGESALDRYKAGQPQQVAQAPQMTDKERADEIARRRAALAPQPSFEQKIGKFIADERATPAPTAAAPAPARGPVSGLAARAAKQAPAAPAAPAIDPAVMADAQAAQAQLDQSPIARVVGGTGGTMTIQYKDGTTKQVGQEGMDEVNGFYGLTSRAAKQYDAQPVEIIAGHNRTQAMPELGYQEVPDAIARSGKTGGYVTGLAQGALDRADPVAAEQRLLKTKTDEQIRAHRATDTDRGAEERGLRTQGLRLDLEEKKQVAELKKRAVAGDTQAIQQLNLLGIVGKGDTEAQKARYKLIGDLSQAYAQNPPFDPATKQAIPFEQWAEPMLRSATGTVKSNSAAPQEGKTYTDAQGNKAVFRNGQWQEVR